MVVCHGNNKWRSICCFRFTDVDFILQWTEDNLERRCIGLLTINLQSQIVQIYVINIIYHFKIFYFIFEVPVILSVRRDTRCPVNNFNIILFGWLYGALKRHFQQYFSYIVAVNFIGGGNRNTQKKPPTCRKSLTNFIT